MLLAEMLQGFSILYQRLKVKSLTFGHFYTKSHTKINLLKAWALGLLLAEMPKDFQ